MGRDKSQLIRLIDVVAIAPAMVYAGLALTASRDQKIGLLLVVTGVATFAYNLHNMTQPKRKV